MTGRVPCCSVFLSNKIADQQAPQPPFSNHFAQYCCKLLAPGSTTDVNRETLRCPGGTVYSREIIDLALESAGATLNGEKIHARLKVAPADAHDWKATPAASLLHQSFRVETLCSRKVPGEHGVGRETPCLRLRGLRRDNVLGPWVLRFVR